MKQNAIAVMLLTFLALGGCAPRDTSIIYSPSNDPLISNGVAYDVASLDLNGLKKIAVPLDAEIHICKPGEEFRVVIEKKLAVAARPPEPITIDQSRIELGCATATDGDTLLIGTFGEYIAEGHGGTSVQLQLFLPGDVVVERKDGLSKNSSWANVAIYPDRVSDSLRSAQSKRGLQWHVLPSRPSPESAAQSAKKREPEGKSG